MIRISKEDLAHPEAIRRKIISLSLPAVGENLFRTIFSFVDMAFVGYIGSTALAGVGLSNQVIFIFMAIMFSLNIGTVVLISQNVGAKREEKARYSAYQSIYLGIFVSIVFALVPIFFSDKIFSLFNTTAELKNFASSYFFWILAPSFVFVLPFMFGAILRGFGDTKSPFKITAFANTLNIFLDYCLIFGKFGFPALGVTGAAIATSLSRGVSILIYLFVLFNRKGKVRLSFRFPKPDFFIIGKILSIGFPASIERFMFTFGNLIFAAIVLILGPKGYAAHRIAINVESLSFNAGLGFAIATTTLVGQVVGFGEMEKAKKVAYEAMKITVVLMGSVGILLFLFPDLLIRIFTREIDVINQARIAVRIVSLAQPLLATIFILSGAFRGGGNTKTPMISTGIGVWLIRIPFSYLFVKIMGLGIAGAWYAVVLDMTFKALFLWISFIKKANFKRHVLT